MRAYTRFLVIGAAGALLVAAQNAPASPRIEDFSRSGSQVAATTSTDPAAFPFTAKIAVGEKRSCTGALVDPSWVLTAASCFTEPGQQPTALAAGAPADRTTVIVGRTDLTTTVGQSRDVIALVPRTDRDLVLARLSIPVFDITPATLSSTAPASAETLQAIGYGRTRTEWVPNKPHLATFTASAPATGGFALTPAAPTDATVCKGDAGSPVWRAENGKPALAGVVSRSWQGGCLGTDAAETRTGAYATRADDLGAWVTTTVSGPYLLRNVVTGKCADLPSYGPGVIDGPINQYTCDGSSTDNQLFYWDKHGTTADGYDQFTIRNAKDNLCFDVHGYDAVEAGSKVSEYTCNGTSADNQLFKRVPRPDGGVWVVNVKSNLCLDVDGVRTGGDDARLTVYTCSDNDDHSWQQR